MSKRSKGKAYATTFSDSDSSIFYSEDSCDEEENFSAFMTIAHVESLEDLILLMQELGEHSDERVAKAALKKMKKAEEDYRSLLM